MSEPTPKPELTELERAQLQAAQNQMFNTLVTIRNMHVHHVIGIMNKELPSNYLAELRKQLQQFVAAIDIPEEDTKQ